HPRNGARANRVTPSSKRTAAVRPNSRRAAATTWRTSPARNWPVTTGGGPSIAAVNEAARSPTVRSDHTVKDLLALPTPRTTIVAAKFFVTGVWCLLLAAQTYLPGLLVGAGLGLPGWSAGTAAHGLLCMALTGVMMVALVAPFGLAASIGRGYLAAVGVLLATVFVAQIVATLGYGQYFPWSVPALFAGIAGPDQPHPGVVGYALVAAVGAAGVTATGWWWRAADHTT